MWMCKCADVIIGESRIDMPVDPTILLPFSPSNQFLFQVMIHFLHVIILFQAINEFQYVLRLFLG